MGSFRLRAAHTLTLASTSLRGADYLRAANAAAKLGLSSTDDADLKAQLESLQKRLQDTTELVKRMTTGDDAAVILDQQELHAARARHEDTKAQIGAFARRVQTTNEALERQTSVMSAKLAAEQAGEPGVAWRGVAPAETFVGVSGAQPTAAFEIRYRRALASTLTSCG